MEITVKGNNVYRNGSILNFSDGEGLLVREPLDITDGSEDQYHRVKMTDRIDLLAYNYYKSRVDDPSKFWWVIADANNIENPLDLSDFVGKEIVIPSILNTLLIIQD